MSWTCPECSETYNDTSLIKCVCGYERIEEPEIIPNECVACGRELPQDVTYCSHCDKASTVISKKESASIKTANRWMLILCGLFLVEGAIVGWISKEDVRLFVYLIYAFLALAMLLLFFWGRRSPFPAIVTALCIYLALMALNAMVDPTTLIQGLILKIFVLGAFLGGIKAAMVTRSAMKA